ncbi:rhodanese-like domain-containing protein [uncultured Roseivirga sp.]|uniref:rhodanese-like domain-containing protein n=1 Tax=uncultured Roseivirga sp. TaxID=543088 RepID=UPI0030D7FE43|tara:strand:+ start:15982 stop:16368 length:387 start_codon:yes stop_codon:yes gene_type:complete
MMKPMLFLIFGMAFLTLGCTENIAKQVDVNEFETLMADEASVQIIDVRTPDEYAQGAIKNSTLMNFNAPDFKNKLEGLDKNKPVAVYCHSGGRSNQAFEMMKEMGFKQIYELQGGIAAWQAGGKEIQR